MLVGLELMLVSVKVQFLAKESLAGVVDKLINS